MKRFLAILFIGFAVASCNNADKKTVAEVELPIPLASPYNNWSMGSTENVVAAMKGLKAFVDNDFTALAASIGDSIEIDFDLFQAKLSRDSAIKFFQAGRPMYNDLKIVMNDYVSVISADKKSEWVTLWYKQIWKNEKGEADSMNVVNDIRLVNGKMVELDEKVSHFMKK